MACVSGFVSGLGAVCLAALVAAAGGHDARAQAYKGPALDTVFYLTDTSGFRVIEATPDSVTTENGRKARFTWVGGMLENVPAADRARLGELFPLRPGGRFSYTATFSNNASSQIELSVQGSDTLEVGGKTMPVMRVTRHYKGVPPSTFEGEYTIWYSVEYGFPLKMSYRHIAGNQPNFRDWQVVRIAAPGAASAAADRSLDGRWHFRIQCMDTTWTDISADVRNGVATRRLDSHPQNTSSIKSDITVSRDGDELVLAGDSNNAAGKTLVFRGHGTLIGDRVDGTGAINTKSGCAFYGQRLRKS